MRLSDGATIRLGQAVNKITLESIGSVLKFIELFENLLVVYPEIS